MDICRIYFFLQFYVNKALWAFELFIFCSDCVSSIRSQAQETVSQQQPRGDVATASLVFPYLLEYNLINVIKVRKLQGFCGLGFFFFVCVFSFRREDRVCNLLLSMCLSRCSPETSASHLAEFIAGILQTSVSCLPLASLKTAGFFCFSYKAVALYRVSWLPHIEETTH